MPVGVTNIFLRALPYNDELIVMEGKDKGKATDELSKWSEGLQRQVGASPVAPVPATELGAPPAAPITASVSGTLGGTFTSGAYQISVYREVITADPVSSSLAVTFTWTHNGKALTRTLSAFAGAPQVDTDTAGDVTVIEIDANTTIGYTLTYASNTPGLAGFQIMMLAQLLQTVR